MSRFTFLLAFALVAAQAAADPVLDRIAERGEIRLAMRPDVPPFSAKVEDTFEGYSVDLCGETAQRVADVLDQELKLIMVEVTAGERFDALRDGRADLLCEATTYTLDRPLDEKIEFSLMTFVTGSTFLYNDETAGKLEESDLDRVGAVNGTTAADALVMISASPEPDEVKAGRLFETYDEAAEALSAGEIDILLGDRLVLQSIQSGTPALQEGVSLSSRYLSYEPYALAVPQGALELREILNYTLADLYRSGEVGALVLRHFKLDDIPRDLSTMYRLLSLR